MYIYGKNVAKEQLATNSKIARAYISKKFKDQNIIDLLRNKEKDLTLRIWMKYWGNYQ